MGDERPVMEGPVGRGLEGPGQQAAPSPRAGVPAWYPQGGSPGGNSVQFSSVGGPGRRSLVGNPTPLVLFKTLMWPAGQCRPQPWPLTLPGVGRILTPPSPTPAVRVATFLRSRGAVLTDGETK